MELVIQKFGGTSVATEDSRLEVYKKIEKKLRENKKVLAVVSAMGREGDAYATDTLLSLLKKENNNVNLRELDMIYSCGEIISGCIITANLQKKGHNAICLTGYQSGILTDTNFTDATIKNIDIENIVNLLNKNDIIIIAGSQGINEFEEVTSLGRGGSDITASALGNALNLKEVEIYSDTDGIMSGDPRKIEKTKLIKEISYIDCINIVENSEKQVMHPRSIYKAMESNLKLKIKPTFNKSKGTCIGDYKREGFYILCVTDIEYKERNEVIISLIGNELKNVVDNVERILYNKNIKVLEIKEMGSIIKASVGKSSHLEALNELHKLITIK